MKAIARASGEPNGLLRDTDRTSADSRATK